jgi:hypothetical protein
MTSRRTSIFRHSNERSVLAALLADGKEQTHYYRSYLLLAGILDGP